MARAVDPKPSASGHSVRSERNTYTSRFARSSGPQPIGDFLPRLETHVRWIPVRIWREDNWQVAWIVIRSVELVHVDSNRSPRARRFAWRDHA